MSSDIYNIHPDYLYPKTTEDSSLVSTENNELAENLDLLVNRIKLYRTALLGITSNSQQLQNQQRLEFLISCLSKEPSSYFEYNAVGIFYQNYLADAIPNSISEDNFLLQITNTCIVNCYNPITDQGISINSLALVLYYCFLKVKYQNFLLSVMLH